MTDIIYRLPEQRRFPWRDALAMYRHLVWWIRHPDPGSEFDEKTRRIRGLPGPVLIALLLVKRYHARLLVANGKVEAQFYAQRHGKTLHIFGTEVLDDKKRRQGIGSAMLRELLIESYNAGDYAVRLSAGDRQGTKPGGVALWRKTLDGRLNLPFKVIPSPTGEIGWIIFVR